MRAHGTYGRYTRDGCRCADCTTANRSVHKRNLARRFARTAANGGVAPVAAYKAVHRSQKALRSPVPVQGCSSAAPQGFVALRPNEAAREASA